MKPGFALSLSFEGISLLQRAAGGWRSVGQVSLDTSDLTGDLAQLRDKANALGPEEMRCKIVIPNDQIRYLTVETGSFDGEARQSMVRQALDGATPYPVDDLAFDISVDGSTTHVAAVAHDTLAEAESFAVEHGFNPLSFVAAPGENPFLGEPFFGAAAHAATLPGATAVESDGIAVVVIGPAEVPTAHSAPDSASEPESPLQAEEHDSEPQPDAEPEPALAGFSSRRKRTTTSETGSEPKSDSEEIAEDSTPTTGTPSLGGAKRGTVPLAPAKPVPIAFKTSVSTDDDQRDEPPEDISAPLTVSVTSPTLDIPEAGDPDSQSIQAPISGLSGFLSRRKKTERNEPAPVSPPRTPSPVPPAPAPLVDPAPSAGPQLTPVSRPDSAELAGAPAANTPEDEAARMTVFGAREQVKVGGKPKHLGLILAAALLLFLAAVAAWASIFLDDGIAGLFRATPAKTELAAVPGTPGIGVKAADPGSPTISDETVPASLETTPDIPVVTDEAPTTLALAPPPTEPELPDLLPPPRHITQPVQPTAPGLSETDAAVLDALSQPTEAEEQAAVTPEQPTQDPPLPEGQPDAAVAGTTGLLQSAPQVPVTPSIIGLDDLYVASIDRTDLSQDAVALPVASSLATDRPLGAVNSPVAAGTAFDLGPRGLVVASVQGTLNPDGVMVYLGRPASVPPAVPTRFETQPETDATIDRLAGLRPRLRPTDLEERFERSNLGGLTRDELSGLRPKTRPESHQQEAEPEDAAPTAQAVVSSRIPKPRPGNFAAIVSAAVRPTISTPSNSGATSGNEQVATVAPRTVSPSIPSSASVARQATLKNEINLRRVNLIGVYGTPSNRRALVRLPSGRYKKVKVGDTVDGGRVVAIGDSELRYQKSGRNMTLKIPSS